MAKKKIDWGVPDWQIEADYAYTEKLTHEQWRWEFIRRRDDYRREWQKAKPIPRSTKHIRHAADGQLILDPLLSGNKLDRFDLTLLRAWAPKPRAAWKHTFDLGRDPAPQLREVERMFQWWKEKGGKIKKQRNPKKGDEHVWPGYLQARDAETANAKRRDIGEIVCKAQDYYTAGIRAKQYLDRYRELSEDFPPPPKRKRAPYP